MQVRDEDVCDALFEALPVYSKMIGRRDVLRLIDDVKRGQTCSPTNIPGYGIDDVVILNTVIAMINLAAAFVNFLAARAKAKAPSSASSELFARGPSVDLSLRELAETLEGRKLLRWLARED